jgi:cytochrome o ubiquinol oxidase subunit 3
VLGRNYATGPSAPRSSTSRWWPSNTSLLLLSSITYGFAVIAMTASARAPTLVWLAVTGLLGCGFVGIELHEFANH